MRLLLSRRAMQTFVNTSRMIIAGQPSNSFGMNEYILGCKRTKQAALIDCGGKPDEFLNLARKFELSISKILQTHAHVDHIAGLPDTRKAIPDAKIYLHPDDFVWYNKAKMQSVMFGLNCSSPPPVDHELSNFDSLSVGDLSIRVIHTPGHCPGHCVFVVNQTKESEENEHELWKMMAKTTNNNNNNGENGEKQDENRNEMPLVVFTGDLLFRGSVGRTDLPYSEPDKMPASLARVMLLDDERRVFSGHMEDSTIGDERRHNPFVQNMPRGRAKL